MPVTSPPVNKIIVGNANLEAPRRESGKDSPVKGGGQTPPDKSISVRQGMQNKMPITATRLSDATLGDKRKLLSDKLDSKGPTRDGAVLGKLRDQTLQTATGGNKTLNEALGPPPDKLKLLADKLDPKGLPRDGAALGGLRDEALLSAKDGHKALNEALAPPRQLSASLLTDIKEHIDWSPKLFPSKVDEQAGWAHKLMSRAAELDNLAVELLMERKGLLGGDFAAMTREQMAEAMNDVPLAKLLPEDRMQLTGLRAKHRELMNTAETVLDAVDAKTTAKSVKPELKRLSAALKTCEKRLSGFIEKTPVEDRAAWQSLLGRALAGTEIKMHDAQVEHLARYTDKTDKGSVAIRRSLEGLFNAIAQMRQEEKALLQGGKTALATKVLGELGLSAQIGLQPKSKKLIYNDASFMAGIVLLKQCAAKKSSMKGSDFSPENIAAMSNKHEPLLDIFGARQTVRMTPTTDVSVQKMLADLMPLPAKGVPVEQEEREINSLVWKFNNAMRFNVDKRLYMGLTPNMQSQIFSFAGKAPLSDEGKLKLYTRLAAAFASHFPDVPKEFKSITGTGRGKSAPQILRMDGWDRPVLLKKIHIETKGNREEILFKERMRELVFNSFVADNPNIPRVLGVALPKEGGLASEDAAIIFETVPGKDLFAFIPDTGDDTLLSAMSPMARAKASVHIVSGAVRGLAPLHAQGIAHNDLKPGNIMLNEKTLEACLIDFGSMSRPGEIVPMSGNYVPEGTFSSSLSVDVYSLGRLLSQLAYGKEVDFLLGHQYFPMLMGDDYWKENGEVGQILAAANILSNEDPVKRPTMDQLLAIIEGRKEVPQATDQGGASKNDLAVLQTVFGPQGLFADGQSEIASRLR